MKKIALIHRNPVFSPHCEANDAAILSAVAHALATKGVATEVFSEESFCTTPTYFPLIVSMARGEKTLQILDDFAKRGAIAINSSQSIRNCLRESQFSIFEKNHVPVPATKIFYSTDFKTIRPDDFHTEKIWIKRADSHTLSATDVIGIEKYELSHALSELTARNAQSITISEHAEGDLIKCYGVTDSNFFRRFYPQAEGYSKFGIEKCCAALSYYPFDEKALQTLLFDVAKMLGLTIFGADCIISPNGEINIIDFNDFPSFAAFREDAAEAIALHVKKIYDTL